MNDIIYYLHFRCSLQQDCYSFYKMGMYLDFFKPVFSGVYYLFERLNKKKLFCVTNMCGESETSFNAGDTYTRRNVIFEFDH